MKYRQPVDAFCIRGQFIALVQKLQVAHQITVTDHDPFRACCRTGGVLQKSHVLRLDHISEIIADGGFPVDRYPQQGPEFRYI